MPHSSFFAFFHSSALTDCDSSEEDGDENGNVSIQRETAEMLRLRFMLDLLGEAAEVFQGSHPPQKSHHLLQLMSEWSLYIHLCVISQAYACMNPSIAIILRGKIALLPIRCGCNAYHMVYILNR